MDQSEQLREIVRSKDSDKKADEIIRNNARVIAVTSGNGGVGKTTLTVNMASSFIKKGKKVFIEGRLQTRSWDDQNGVKKYRTEIIAENISMLDTKGSSYQNNNQQNNTQEQNNNVEEELPVIDADSEEINIEDIPF